MNDSYYEILAKMNESDNTFELVIDGMKEALENSIEIISRQFAMALVENTVDISVISGIIYNDWKVLKDLESLEG